MKDSRKDHAAATTAPNSRRRYWANARGPGRRWLSVALSHGINANVVHKWRRLAHAGAAPLPVASFLPVALPAPT
jgi:transposase